MFTTLFGWMFYDFIWEILVKTGIVLIPFIMIIITTMIESRQSGDSGSTALGMIRTLEIRLLLAFFVVLFAAQPIVTLTVNEVTYTPRAIRGLPTQTEHPHDNNTTYGSISFKNYPESVKVPLLWYATLNTITGINRSVMEAVPPIKDFRTYINQMRLVSINDDYVRQETNQFYTDCFVPARSKYYDDEPGSTAVTERLEEYGREDPEWIGSRIYSEVPGYYDKLRAETPVKGFPYNATRDKEWEADDPGRPEFGRPNCREWWNTLREKLVEQDKEAGLWTNFINYDWDEGQRKDNLVKNILSRDPPKIVKRGPYYAYLNGAGEDGDRSLLQDVRDIVGWLAIFGEAATHETFLSVFLKIEDELQALVLMGIFALLPFLVLFMGFKIESMLYGVILLVSVKILSLLWFLAWWVDNNLLLAMYPETGMMATSLAGSADLAALDLRALLSTLTGSLHIILPLIFFMIASYAGVNMSGISDMVSSTAQRWKQASENMNRNAINTTVEGYKWNQRRKQNNERKEENREQRGNERSQMRSEWRAELRKHREEIRKELNQR
nr:conjugal transfer protein TraG N-terminal domain-containing protein [Spartinivicinus marinus]